MNKILKIHMEKLIKIIYNNIVFQFHLVGKMILTN